MTFLDHFRRLVRPSPGCGDRRSDLGAGLVEYALLVALIALAALGSLQILADSNGGSINKSAEEITSAIDR